MVKIFIGNLSPNTDKDEIEALFAKYGTVTECAKYKNYAFVHMDDRKSSTKAIRELHLHKLDGRPINVEPSRSRDQGPVKLHVANVESGHDSELRDLFLEYGEVTECAIIKNFAFVHMPNHDEAMDAMKGLDNTEFRGKHIHVQVSKSAPRRRHEEEEEEEYPPPPGGRGYYPPPYPDPRPEPSYRGRGRMSAYPPPPPPRPLPPPPSLRRPPYLDRGYGERDPYSMVDYYEKYRARPYSAAIYEDRRSIPPPPPPPPALARARLSAGSLDPYERRPIPPPPPSYAVRDRSPIRRVLVSPSSSGNGYYERARLSPVSRVPVSRIPVYPPPRARDPYSERAPPPPPPPPPRYAGY